MRKIIAFIMVTTFLLTACHVQSTNEQVFSVNAADSQKMAGGQISQESEISQDNTVETADSQIEELDRGFKAKIGKEIGPIFSEKTDTSKQSVYTNLYPELASWTTKGDDGSCYYFRNEGKGKNEKLVFYKNNGIKVCETTIKKSIKNKYHIRSFVKYGSRFFLAFALKNHDDYGEGILTTIDMETGEWGKVIEAAYDCWNMMVYEDCFYCKSFNGTITRYDLSGETLKLKKVASDDDFEQYIQCIVDGKIYYIVTPRISVDKSTKIMRSNLDGSDRETLFKYSSSYMHQGVGSLQIDGDYMYLLGKFGKVRCLAQIPMYGGKIEKVAEKPKDNRFELSEDGIFFCKGSYIYKLDKDLGGEPKVVTKVYYPKSYISYAAPYYYADGHLMMQGYNKQEIKMINNLLHDEVVDWDIYIDIMVNYADDYYWVSEDGEVEAVIKGTGLKKRWKKEFKKMHQYFS